MDKKINNNYYKLSKTDTQLIEEDVVNSIINNEKIEYPHNCDFLTQQTVDEIDEDRIKEEIEYLKTALQVRSRDFETIQNIEDKKQNELLKSITDPADGLITNDKITINDYTIDDNNNAKPINVPSNINNIVNNIINITTQNKSEDRTKLTELLLQKQKYKNQ